MGLLDLFFVASMPVIRVLLLTALGSFLALGGIDILGDVVMKQLNTVVYFVFNPALVYSNLANTITLERIVLLDAAIPCIILIMGGNLLKGLKGSGIQLLFIVGIVAVRYIFLPLLGILSLLKVHFDLVWCILIPCFNLFFYYSMLFHQRLT